MPGRTSAAAVRARSGALARGRGPTRRANDSSRTESQRSSRLVAAAAMSLAERSAQRRLAGEIHVLAQRAELAVGLGRHVRLREPPALPGLHLGARGE